MGFSTFIEVDHDKAHAIQGDPLRFGELMGQYTNACDPEIASELAHRFGVKVWVSGNRGGWEDPIRKAMVA